MTAKLGRLSLAVCILAASAVEAQRPLPSWTRGATCYEVFVRSFQDSDGDGIGDLKGLIQKLDYINDGNPRSSRDLGARCIWLMPVAESPSYHGYDVADYYRVEKDYGTNDDFKALMKAAHKRGIKVLVDMVLNHSSSKHPNFEAALRDTASPYRAWYRFSPTKPPELNPWGQSNWHKSPVRGEWYYAFFWGGMPDLNYTYRPVVEEAEKIARFWLEDMGVDGFRLDAVPYLIEEPGHIHHSPSTHALLNEYGSYVRKIAPASYTVGEVTEESNVLYDYYPDQLDSYFAFELADSLIKAVARGTTGGMLAPVMTLQAKVPEQRWSPFLTNHDQPRVRTLLGGNAQKARIAATLMLTMPGLPFVYYGEEIGMMATKPDERLRTPMQWNAIPGGGFTSGRAWEAAQPDSMSLTVSAQDRDAESLLALYRRLIHLRSSNTALATGTLIPVLANDDAVVVYARRADDRTALVIANLGDTPRDGVAIRSTNPIARDGRYALRSRLDDTKANTLTIANGQFDGFIPVATLAPLTAYILELTAPGRP